MTIGLFHVQYRVAVPNLLGPVLYLNLLVNTPDKSVSGFSVITQALALPPIRGRVWGRYAELKPDHAAESLITLSLHGTPAGPVSAQVEVLEFHGLLKPDWQSGTAHYRFFENDRWHAIQHAVVTRDTSPIPHLPPHDHPVPLYGVGLQEARASGDLSRMKALARQAEQQLADHDAISAALAKLETEISRLTARR
ncbi:DUF1842 domain-containing protein [Burkholderia alba]|uniref:DUF1842 domain-containing protein n=1 Tax=Burkholderia alba TaxID=2683677 RepID=UPI002B053D65|nr:DUF1842 domain-containing protein [Burkholderia alba]